MQRFKQIQITRAPRSEPLGHLPQRMDFFVAYVHNLGKSLLDLYVDNMDLVVPRMVADTLKNQLPQILTDSVRETLPGLIEGSGMHFMMRCLIFFKGEVAELIWQFANHQMQLIAYLEQILHSIVKVPNDILVVSAQHLTSKVNRTLADIKKLVGLVSRVVQLMETSAPCANATTEGEKEA
ncbi:hypothetical protein Tco_0251008 [Tanacetum coccineum]